MTAAMSRFEGRVVLVTGAASGIGEAAAKRFASATTRINADDESERRSIDEKAMACTAASAQSANPVS